jgi:hypothetical protein
MGKGGAIVERKEGHILGVARGTYPTANGHFFAKILFILGDVY